MKPSALAPALRLFLALCVALVAAASSPDIARANAETMPAPAAVALGGETGTTRGAALYAARCARCHGDDARGDGPDAPYFVRPPRDLRGASLAVYGDDELVARIRDGAPLRLELDPQAMRTRARDVDSLVAFLQKLPDIDWNRVEPGNEIYLDRCEICHGPFGRPAPGMPLPPGVRRTPRDLSSREFQRSVSDAELIEIVQHGRSGMPAIPGLQSGGDAELLVAFVRTLSPGRELYGAYCTGCHGEDGRGAGAALAAGAPPVVLDRAYLDGRDPEDLATKVWHMLDQAGPSMPHFAPRLREEDAAAIVSYLRRRAPVPAPTATPH